MCNSMMSTLGDFSHAHNPIQGGTCDCRKNSASNQHGEGFRDTVKDLYEKGKRGAMYIYDNRGKIVDAYTGEIGTMVRNALPDSDERARPGFVGEKHAIMKLPNGSFGVANYCGPSTEVIKRLKRGDPPRNNTDRACQKHDISYFLAKDEDDISTADTALIKDIAKIERQDADWRFNTQLIGGIMKGKKLGESTGLLQKGQFSGELDKQLSSEDEELLKSQLNKLQSGQGLKKILKQLKKQKLKKQKGKGKLPELTHRAEMKILPHPGKVGS